MKQAFLGGSTKDPFKLLGVSSEDKMSFFLLKWIFNAIKRDSAKEDPKLLGKPYVTKTELTKQLAKNPELMDALEVSNQKELAQGVKLAACAKEGCFTWEELLDYFFLKNATLQDRIDGNDWWNKLDVNGNRLQTPDKISNRNEEHLSHSGRKSENMSSNSKRLRKMQAEQLIADLADV